MNARRIALTAVAALTLAGAAASPAAATPPDGLIACVENSKWQLEYYLEHGQIDYPTPPCKPLT
jgi:hypothetical protein